MFKKIIILFVYPIIVTFVVTTALGGAYLTGKNQPKQYKTLYGEFADLEKRVEKLEKENKFLQQEIDKINNEDWLYK